MTVPKSCCALQLCCLDLLCFEFACFKTSGKSDHSAGSFTLNLSWNKNYDPSRAKKFETKLGTKSLERNLMKGRIILRFPVQISLMRLISIASVRTAAGEFFLFFYFIE